MFCTHLDWQFDLGVVRREQVRFIVDRIEEVSSGADFPAILVGDFNAEPDSDEMRFLRGLTPIDGKSVYFCDAFLLAGDGTQGATFSRANVYAAREREPERRIDYVLVGRRRDGRGEPSSSRVVFTEPEGAVFASDHFGVMADLSAAKLGAGPP